MFFQEEWMLLEKRIEQAEDLEELNYLRVTNEKKYWWTSIFVAGLFYALNGRVGKMFLTWILGFVTLGIYALYIIYTSYRDQNEFNNQMEYAILQRSKELRGKKDSGRPQKTFEETQDVINTFDCPECGFELNESFKFCPNCGSKVEIPQNQVNFCTECGAKIMDGAKFCHECGNSIAEDETMELPESDVKLIPNEIGGDVIELPEGDANSIDENEE